MSLIFQFPDGLRQVAFFQVPEVRTWGTLRDQEFKEIVRRTSGITCESGQEYAWFVFVIRCRIAVTRTRWAKQVPDIENVPKLIVDAFTGLLYPDDNIVYVRGIQVEGLIDEGDRNGTDIWIFGFPKDQNGTAN